MVLVNSGTATAAIQVNDTGFYQVTYGVTITALNSSHWDVEINGTAATGALLNTRAAGTIISLTVIIRLTTSGSLVAIANNTGGGLTVADAGGAGVVPAAYLTIVKLL